jgi:hypothetical protein
MLGQVPHNSGHLTQEQQMSSFDKQVHIEELIPTCPYCDKVLEGMVIGGFHAHCSDEYALEINRLYDQPEPDQPIEVYVYDDSWLIHHT